MAWYKYGKMVFPTSRNANKHTLLALGSGTMLNKLGRNLVPASYKH